MPTKESEVKTHFSPQSEKVSGKDASGDAHQSTVPDKSKDQAGQESKGQGTVQAQPGEKTDAELHPPAQSGSHATLENPNPDKPKVGQPAVTGNPHPVEPVKEDPSKEFKGKGHSRSKDDFSSKWVDVKDPNEITKILGSVHIQKPDQFKTLKVAYDNNAAYHAVYGSKDNDSKFEPVYERGDLPKTFDKK